MSATAEVSDFKPSSLVFPDDAPLVSMDIKLGKTYDFIDFDYGAYMEEAARLGIDSQVSERLNIELDGFHKSMTLRKVPRTRANPVQGIIQATIRDEINADLAHEMQHISDGCAMDGRYVIGKLAELACLPLAFMPGIVVAATEKNGQLDVIPDAVAFGVFLGGLAVLKSIYRWGYHRHPDEIRARQAEENASKIITLHKKT